jgi:hypothetical protein
MFLAIASDIIKEWITQSRTKPNSIPWVTARKRIIIKITIGACAQAPRYYIQLYLVILPNKRITSSRTKTMCNCVRKRYDVNIIVWRGYSTILILVHIDRTYALGESTTSSWVVKSSATERPTNRTVSTDFIRSTDRLIQLLNTVWGFASISDSSPGERRGHRNCSSPWRYRQPRKVSTPGESLCCSGGILNYVAFSLYYNTWIRRWDVSIVEMFPSM